MSQEYTPVQWVDETATEPGTVINKARLDQMQTAHHYADGFETVDTVPSADPGVDYRKVVYCTADNTLYMWDGTQWITDLDKSKIVTSWTNPPTDTNIPSEKLVKDSLDGKVTIVPVSSGIKFYGQGSGGPAMYQGTSGATTGITSIPLRDSSGRIKTAGPSANEDAANKKYVDDLDALAMHLTQTGNVNLTGNLTITGNITQNGSSYETHAEKVYTTNDYIITRDGATGALASGDYSGFQVKKYDGTNDGRLVIDNTGTARVGDVGDEEPLLTRDEAASMTDGAILKWDGTNYKAVTESANIGSDTKPIKIVGGVATAVANDLLTVNTAQEISNLKTIKTGDFTTGLKMESAGEWSSGTLCPPYLRFETPSKVIGTLWATKTGANANHLSVQVRDEQNNSWTDVSVHSENGTNYVTAPNRAYHSANTADVVTIGMLDSSSRVEFFLPTAGSGVTIYNTYSWAIGRLVHVDIDFVNSSGSIITAQSLLVNIPAAYLPAPNGGVYPFFEIQVLNGPQIYGGIGWGRNGVFLDNDLSAGSRIRISHTYAR